MEVAPKSGSGSLISACLLLPNKDTVQISACVLLPNKDLVQYLMDNIGNPPAKPKRAIFGSNKHEGSFVLGSKFSPLLTLFSEVSKSATFDSVLGSKFSPLFTFLFLEVSQVPLLTLFSEV